MNIKKKIGQLFTLGFTGTKINQEIIQLIHEYHIGGVILFKHNIKKPSELLELTENLQNEAKKAGYKYPLLIAIDEENGIVKRLGDKSSGYPGAMSLSATNNSDYAYCVGKMTGNNLKRFGINWNIAPVLDVNNNPENPVIGVRSFGETAEDVSKYGIKFMKGLQDSGVISTLKHFPGHGDTNIDTHETIPKIEHAMERLNRIELKPFKRAIMEGAESIMTTHINFTSLESEENLPATLSKIVLTDLLRENMSFDGVIVTDALEMKALSDNFGVATAAVKAFKAGADNLLIGHEYDKQIEAITELIKSFENNEISEKQIQKSINRLDSLKEKIMKLYNSKQKDIQQIPSKFHTEKDNNLSKELYKKSVTVIKAGKKIDPSLSVLVLQPDNEWGITTENTSVNDFTLYSVIREHINKVKVEIIKNNLNKHEKQNILKKARDADAIIIGTISANKNDDLIKFINKIGQFKKINLISMGNPYVGQWIENLNYWINTYESNEMPVNIAIKTLIGNIKASGTSPVSLKIN